MTRDTMEVIVRLKIVFLWLRHKHAGQAKRSSSQQLHNPDNQAQRSLQTIIIFLPLFTHDYAKPVYPQ